MQTDEKVAQLKAEIDGLEKIVGTSTGKIDPALLAKVQAAIASLKRTVDQLESERKS